MTFPSDQKDGQKHRERSRGVDGGGVVRAEPSPLLRMAVLTLGILQAEIWEVCICTGFQTESCPFIPHSPPLG